VGALDRRVSSEARPGKERAGTIHAMLEDDGWCDWYRHCHPIPLDGCLDLTPADLGHTYFDPGGGSSRIDYVMIYPRPPGAGECVVDDEFQLGSDMHHRPLTFRVDLHVHPRKPQSKPARPSNAIYIDHLSPSEQASLAQLINARVSEACPAWCAALDALSLGEDEKMAEICDSFSACLTSVCTKPCRLGSARRRGRKRGQPMALRRLLNVRRHLFSLRNAVGQLLEPASRSNHLSTFKAGKALDALRRLSALPSLNLQPIPGWGDLANWTRWLERSSTLMGTVKAEIHGIRRKTPDHRSHEVNRAFRTPQGRGRFYKSAKSGWMRAGQVECARNPDTGELERDPDSYMPLVRDAVSRPFSTKKHGPAVPAWRPLSEGERLTGIPGWWLQMYSRDPNVDPDTQWDSIMRLCDPAEILHMMSGIEHHKSPGKDGITTDILKLTSREPSSPVLSFLVSLVNASLRTGCCPPTLKEGIIVMIPKPGAPADDVSGMRPITLLPELGKLTARLLAKRVTAVLHSKPHILCEAQRAYLKDGSSKQCIAALLDTIEDFQERRGAGELLELIVTSYDIRKAFDSVQHFSIRASCERLNLPDGFITYLLSTLTGAESRVKCADGLTDTFPILSSVRQGDPLAALIFIFVMDALHAGLQQNPLEEPTPGYSLRCGPTVHSLGYSDDTVTTADSWDGALLQHDWVREFLVAHHLRLNSQKSYCIVGSGVDVSIDQPTSSRWLPGILEAQVHDPRHGAPCSVTGRPAQFGPEDVCTHGPNKAFWYLGYQVRVDLGNGEVIRATAFKVREACSVIRSHCLSLVQAADLLREYLYPRIELGLLYADIPNARLKRWESLIRGSVLHRGHDVATRALASTALHAALGILPLRAHARLLKATEVGVTLRGGGPITEATADARLRAALADGRLRTASHSISGKLLKVVTETVAHHLRARCRTTNAIRYAQANGHTIAVEDFAKPVTFRLPVTGEYNEKLGCFLLPHAGTAACMSQYCVQHGYEGPGLIAFTDGSFVNASEDGLACQSGFAVVLCKLDDVLRPGFDFGADECVVLSGTAPISGANYTAEMMALLTTLHAVPVNVPLQCGSDALSALQTIQKRWISKGAALRLGARSLALPTRALVRIRTEFDCPPDLRHIESHTTKTGAMYRGNAEADRLADKARGEPRCPALTHEGAHTFWRDQSTEEEERFQGSLWHVSGDLRSSLKAAEQSTLLSDWQTGTSSQGIIAREAGAGLLNLLDAVRRTQDALLFTFLVKAATRQLATADKLFPVERRRGLLLPCPLCGEPENHEHPFLCGVSQTKQEAAVVAIRQGLGELCDWIRTTGAVSTAHCTRLQVIEATADFFDVRSVDNQMCTVHSRYAGALGVLPHQFPATLAPDAELSGPEHAVKFMRKHLHSHIRTFQLTALRETMTVYNLWTAQAKQARQARQGAGVLLPPIQYTSGISFLRNFPYPWSLI